ncbi:putative lon protease [Iris pallida]|uniref:Lon protease n=1 Tax=Iris pallida TaxID=29817 RepID=A0AAX6EDZ4_IRIPA|nr:putative lon protease [Iris pallida]
MSLLPHAPNFPLHFRRHPQTLTLTRRHRPLLRCSSSSSPPPPAESSSSSETTELPIFPLPLVLFPGAILPLQIFEFRYRIMMHTLLHSPDSPRFGVLFSSPSPGSSSSAAAASVGCVAEVVKHERLADDRFFLIAKGQERFRVSSVLRTKPYLVADVSFLEDRPPPGGEDDEGGVDLEGLASEVEELMRDVIRISNRLNGKKKKAEGAEAEVAEDLRRGLFPTMFSFFVGSTFEGAPKEQQALLEMEDTRARLKRERETLRNTLNYLTAAAAVKDVFPSSSSSSSS